MSGWRGGTSGLEAFARRPGEGEALWWLGSLAVVIATGEETGGQFALIDVTDSQGETVPTHLHHREDETFIVLEGENDFTFGGRPITARAGTTLFGPRGVPHGYKVRKGPSRILFLFTPSGFERAVLETSTPALERRLPAEGEGWSDMDALPTVLWRYGCEFVEDAA